MPGGGERTEERRRGEKGRRERQKHARERRIRRAAARLFGARGYAATTIGDIARGSRLAVGTIYNYFPSKPEIALALVRAETGEALCAGEEVLKRPPREPVEAVAALVDVYLGVISHIERDLWREIVAGAVTDPAGLGAAVFAEDVRLLGQLATLLEELRSRGSIDSAADPGRGAIAIYGVYLSWFMAYLASDSIGLDSVRANVRENIDVVMHGLLRPRLSATRRARS